MALPPGCPAAESEFMTVVSASPWPASHDEAIALLARWDAVVLAGGTRLTCAPDPPGRLARLAMEVAA
jgi:hypothetical protein